MLSLRDGAYERIRDMTMRRILQGWLLALGIIMMSWTLHVGFAAQAQVGTGPVHASAPRHSQVDSPQHRSPGGSHCATPIHVTCCPCMPFPPSLLRLAPADAASPPAPRRLGFRSRLVGPALPPPRLS